MFTLYKIGLSLNRYGLLFTVNLAAFAVTLLSGCTSAPKHNTVKAKPQISFKSITGVSYTEVRRYFETGLVFERHGYYQGADWQLKTLSADSMWVYSAVRKKSLISPIILDHDSVINIDWAWLRVKNMSRDSITFQVLKVENKEISHTGPFVFMKFYADDYIKNKLHTTAAVLRKPYPRDTAYIQQLTAQARLDPEKAFAATQPAQLTSTSPALTVLKHKVKPDFLTGIVAEEAYYFPEYNIHISKAYDDFSYSFAVTVDEKGNLHFIRSLQDSYGDPEFEKIAERNIKGIIAGYLKYYLHTVPGRTLNIPHSSMVTLNVSGTKA